MAYNYEYPYTDPNRHNDDWVLHKIKEIESKLVDFIKVNSIKYADPIAWDITSQYEANTVVIDNQSGNAYISTQPVPVGVTLANTDYWTQIYNYANVIETLRNQIAHDEEASPTATQPYSIGDYVFVDGLLYKVIFPMIAGDSFVINSNIEKTTIENELHLILTRLTNAEDDITTLTNNVGNLANLTTVDKDSIVDAINEVVGDVNTVVGDVGNLANLNTTDKTSIVNAINEIYNDILVLTGIKIYNVKAYGAKGDGVANDTNAFKTVANLITSGGGVMYVPSGTYKINDSINMKHVGARLVGDNQQATYVIQTAAKPAFVFGDGINPTINVKVEDIGIISTNNAQDNTCIGLHLNYCVNSLVNNVVIEDFKVGLQFTHTGNSFITNCGVVSSVDYSVAYYMNDQSVSISLNNNYASFSGVAADTGIGLELSNGDIADIHVNYFDVGNGAYGVDINGSTSPSDYPPTDIRLHELVIDGSRLACVNIQHINERGSVTIEGGWLNPLASSGNRCINLNDTYNISIENVTMQQLANSAPVVYGIVSNVSRHTIVSGCKFLQLLSCISSTGSSVYNVIGNNIYLYGSSTSASPAIDFATTSYGNIVSNIFIGRYATGINWTSGNKGNVISNTFYNVTTATNVTITDRNVYYSMY